MCLCWFRGRDAEKINEITYKSTLKSWEDKNCVNPSYHYLSTGCVYIFYVSTQSHRAHKYITLTFFMFSSQKWQDEHNLFLQLSLHLECFLDRILQLLMLSPTFFYNPGKKRGFYSV